MMSQSNASWLAITMTTTAAVAREAGSAYCDTADWTASLFMPAVYGVVFCLGLPGNLLVLSVLWRKGRRLKPAMRVYMLNLAAADALFALTLPAWAAYYARGEDWPLPEACCRLAGAIYYATTYSGITFLTLIALNRYRTLTPTPPRLPMLKGRGAVGVSALAWLTWLACATPSLTSPQSHARAGRVRCFRDVDPRWALAACCFSALSFLAVLSSYLSILSSLRVQPSQQGAHRSRAAIAVLATLLLFLSCVLPYHVTLTMWAWQGRRPPCPALAHRVTTALLSATCCLDPLVYCFSLRHFRMEVRKLLLPARATPSSWLRPRHRPVQGPGHRAQIQHQDFLLLSQGHPLLPSTPPSLISTPQTCFINNKTLVMSSDALPALGECRPQCVFSALTHVTNLAAMSEEDDRGFDSHPVL